MQNRSNTFTQRGGDTVLLERLKTGLEARGVHVSIDLAGALDPKDFDIVHLFNFALPDMVRHFGERAQQAGVPFVVTTLAEDVPSFHNQSIAQASALMEYVARGQDRGWWNSHRPDLNSIERAPRFENSWVAKHARALFTNGAGESAVLRREYSDITQIAEIPLGHEIAARGTRDTFVKEYGVSDFVLCVGRIETRKNQLMLLKALEDSELTVVLAGGGFTYQPTYADAVRAFKRRGKTIILDKISPASLVSAYCAAKVHVLPSWYELPGLVSLEAAAYGCPIVVTDTGTTKDYVGESGWYAKPADEQSILNAVCAAYYGPLKEGLKEVGMKHSWDETAERTLQEYQQILGISPVQSAQPAPVKTIDVGQFDMAPRDGAIDKLLEEGEEAARTRQYNLAHELFEKAERLDPTSVRALRARGAVYMAENLIGQARTFFERALRLNASDAKSMSGLGMCDLQEGKTESAYNSILRALEIEPFQLIAILQLVQCSYILERFEQLEAVLRRYLSVHADDTEMRYCLAGCLFKCDRIAECEAEIAIVLAANPEHQGAQQLKGMIAEKVAAAVPVAPAAPASTPLESAYSSRIQELDDAKKEKRFDEVIERSNQYLSHGGLSKSDKQAFQCLKAEAMVFTSQINEADELFSQILVDDANCARALCGRGAIASSRGDSASARSCFERALKVAPRNDTALAGLGMVEQAGQQLERAWDLYQQALDLNPENGRALYGVIELGYQNRRMDAVEKAIQGYLDCHPADLNYLFALAGCYYAQERIREATEQVGRILLFDPQNKNALDLQKLIDQRSADRSQAGSTDSRATL